MKLAEYLKNHGSQTVLARGIKAQPQLIWQWATEKRQVPIGRCVPIERATSGAVTRKDLRPTDYLDIWPELAVFQPIPTQAAIKAVAEEAQTAIRHLEQVAEAEIKHVGDEALLEERHVAQVAEAEIRHVAEGVLAVVGRAVHPLKADMGEVDYD